MRKILISAFVALISSSAIAGNYLVVTTTEWIAPNGDVVQAGTAINEVVADQTFNPGPGLTLALDTGQPWYHPKPVVGP